MADVLLTAATRGARDCLASLRAIVGERNVLTGERATRRYTSGIRFGRG